MIRFERLLSVRDMQSGDRMGASIALDPVSGHLAIGAPGSSDHLGHAAGVVHVVEHGSSASRRLARIDPSRVSVQDGERAFGRALAAAVERLLVASDHGVTVLDLLARDGVAVPVLPMRSGPTGHGAALAISPSGYAIVGAPHDAPRAVARAGSAQLYLVDVSLARRLGRTPRVVLVSEVRRRVRDAAPRRAIEARIGEQLLVTAPLLVVAVAAEYALADAVRRPCEGGFRCLGLAIFGPPSLIVAPVMFGVLSSLALALIQGTEGPAPPASPGHSSVPCSAPR